MRISDFINSDFKDFSNLDNIRSIPQILDGLKDSQRKAVYGMMQHGNSEIKVANAAGKFSLMTHYAHGETSMAGTIAGLAKCFPGANNVPPFEAIGQFGSRLSPKEAAHRYIFTKPSKHFKILFRPDDNHILPHRYEDGEKAEPLYMAPVAPLWALNGAEGVGTGHSCKIMPRRPDAVSGLLSKLAKGVNVQQKTIDEACKPWFIDWHGTVENGANANQWIFTGKFERENTTTIKVTELPPNYSVDKYKSILIRLLDNGTIKDYENNSTEEGFNFEIKVPRALGKATDEKVIDTLRLRTRDTENITLWCQGEIVKFDSFYAALERFVELRLSLYIDRKASMLERESENAAFLKAKMQFIKAWHDNDVNKMTDDEIRELMAGIGIRDDFIERFMALRVSSLSLSGIDELERQIKLAKENIEKIEATRHEDMWLDDLKAI